MNVTNNSESTKKKNFVSTSREVAYATQN